MCRLSFTKVLSLALIILLLTVSINADVPQVISYQGRLTDSGGDPVADDSYSVVFTIYDASTGGNAKWTETQLITTNNGLFAVLLGTINPIFDTVFNGTTRYLSIEVAGDPELIPRIELASVPYAQRVSTVDGSSGGSVVGDMVLSGKATFGPGNTNTGVNSFVLGKSNNASGENATISGGWLNTASGSFQSTVSGGAQNTSSHTAATVGGGQSNTAGSLYSTVSGGFTNTADGSSSTVSGGYQNVASGDYSFTVGYADTISAGGDYSVLFGIGSKLTQDSTFMVDMPHVRIGNEVDGFELPTIDGTSGQVLSTDGAGQLGWADPSGGGGSGWTDEGNIVHLTNNDDTVNVGSGSGNGVVNISVGNNISDLHSTGLTVQTYNESVLGTTAGYFDSDADVGPSKGVQAISATSGSDTSYAFNGQAKNHGSGVAVGVYGLTDFVGTGDNIGVLGRGNGAGAGDNYGGHFSTAGGISNTGNKYGVYGLANNLTSSSAYGVYGDAYNPNEGNVYGGYFTTSGNGTGFRFGTYSYAAANNSNDVFGNYSYAYNEGSGGVYGGFFIASSLEGGTGDKRAVTAHSSAYGDAMSIGVDLNTSNSGNGSCYGIKAEATQYSNGGLYGGYFDVNSYSSSDSYGLDIDADGFSTGKLYGIHTDVTNTAAGSNVYGSVNTANGTTGSGVFGTAGNAYGNNSNFVWGVSGYAENLGTGGAEAGYFTASNNGTGTHYGVYSYELSGGSGAAVYASGDLVASGTKSAVTRTSKGTTLMYAVESSEVWFEEFGQGRIVDGATHIELDPLFLETVTVNDANPMKVFIQLNDDCNGTYVKTSLTGFDVYELKQGRSNASFTYRVVAKRKGYEGERMRTAEIGQDDPHLYPERADEILEKMEERKLRK